MQIDGLVRNLQSVYVMIPDLSTVEAVWLARVKASKYYQLCMSVVDGELLLKLFTKCQARDLAITCR